MVFGLPAIGETSWGQKILDSINAVKATADAAQPSATLEAAVAAKVGTAGALGAALSASYADRRLVGQDARFGDPQHEDETTYTFPTRINFGLVSPAPRAVPVRGGVDVIAHWYNDFGLEFTASEGDESNGSHVWYDWRWNFPSNIGDGVTTFGYDDARHPIQGFYQGDNADVLDWQAYWLASAGVTAVNLINANGVDPTTWATPAAADHWMYQLLVNAPNARSLRYMLTLKTSGTTAAIEAQNDAIATAYDTHPGAYTVEDNGRTLAAVFMWDMEALRGVYDAFSGQAATVAYLKALAVKFQAIGYDGIAVFARQSGVVYASLDETLLPAGVLILDAAYESRYDTDAAYGNSYATYAETAVFPTGRDQIVNVVTGAESTYPHPSGFALAGSTPDDFSLVVSRAVDSVVKHGQRRIVTVYNVSEWAEGGPGLVPQNRDGFGYLDALRSAVAAVPATGGLGRYVEVATEPVAATAPTLLNSWANFAGFAPASYEKDAAGRVHLNGLVSGGVTSPGTPIFNLPASCRPSVDQPPFGVSSNSAFGEIRVLANGDVCFYAGSVAWISLAGISFPAA